MTPLPPFSEGAFAVNTVAACNVFRVHSEPIQGPTLPTRNTRIYPHVKEKQYVDVLGVTGVTAIRRGGRAEPCRPYGLYNESRGGLIYNVRYTMPEEGRAAGALSVALPRRPDSEEGFDGCVHFDGL